MLILLLTGTTPSSIHVRPAIKIILIYAMRRIIIISTPLMSPSTIEGVRLGAIGVMERVHNNGTRTGTMERDDTMERVQGQ